jgi:uncharacterized RDD family membrane protein YckC
MQRFDEIELETISLGDTPAVILGAPVASDEIGEVRESAGTGPDAPRGKRLFTLLTDLSLFVALALALSPLLPTIRSWTATASLAGFVVLVSYYYFVCCWLFWGKTVGGAIFDVRVVADGSEAMSIADASLRWGGMYLSLATAGVGFMLAALPSRRSLPDRMSQTRAVSAA